MRAYILIHQKNPSIILRLKSLHYSVIWGKKSRFILCNKVLYFFRQTQFFFSFWLWLNKKSFSFLCSLIGPWFDLFASVIYTIIKFVVMMVNKYWMCIILKINIYLLTKPNQPKKMIQTLKYVFFSHHSGLNEHFN